MIPGGSAGRDGNPDSDASDAGEKGAVADGDGGDSTAGRGRLYGSMLWGLVGALSFLVLVQGYELLGGRAVAVGVKAGVAVVVGVAAAVLSYAFGGWLARR